MAKNLDKVTKRLAQRQRNWDGMSEMEKSSTTRPGSMNRRKWGSNRKKL